MKIVSMSILENRIQPNGKRQTGTVRLHVSDDAGPHLTNLYYKIVGVIDGGVTGEYKVSNIIPISNPLSISPSPRALRGERWLVGVTSRISKKHMPLMEVGTANSACLKPGSDFLNLSDAATGTGMVESWRNVIEEYCLDSHGERVTVDYIQFVNRNLR